MPARSKDFIVCVDYFPLAAAISFLADYAKDLNPFPHTSRALQGPKCFHTANWIGLP